MLAAGAVGDDSDDSGDVDVVDGALGLHGDDSGDVDVGPAVGLHGDDSGDVDVDVLALRGPAVGLHGDDSGDVDVGPAALALFGNVAECRDAATALAASVRHGSGTQHIGRSLMRLHGFGQRLGVREAEFFDTSGDMHAFLKHYMDATLSHTMSDVAVSCVLGQSRRTVQSLRLKLAAACFAGMRGFADNLVDQLCSRIRSEGGQCRVLYEVHRGDETPFAKLSVDDLGPAEPPRTIASDRIASTAPAENRLANADAGETNTDSIRVKCATNCKVFQPELQIACLFELPSGRFVLMSIDMPVPLLALESGTGESCAAASSRLSYCMDARKNFDRVQRLVTADGAPSIMLAERVLSKRWVASTASPVESLQQWCLVHRVYKVIEHPLARFEFLISGLIRFALSMRGTGNFLRFNRILRQHLDSVLDFRQQQGGPGHDADRHRERIYELFIPQRGKSMKAHGLRHYIISSLANGDIRVPNTFQHYCRQGCCQNRDHCISKLHKYFMPAIAGHLPPVFLRGRWTKNDRVLDWVGLCESIHGILSAVYRKWFHEVTRRRPPPLHQDAADAIGGDFGVGNAVAEEWPCSDDEVASAKKG